MKNDLITNRAWIEINLDNLENNIKEARKIIPIDTQIMAVVKANAYGHGIIEVSKKLNSIGINDFAVATLEEGILLRENNIKGNILILGYTEINNLKYVTEYDLIQTIVDYDYSESIKRSDFNGKLKCNIKINTGMNRIGEKWDDIEKTAKIYDNPKLDILGTFSHLCVADSCDKDDIEFTRQQISNFNSCVNALKQRGYEVGKIHLQSSYGIINYSDLRYDYVRFGILMYGVNSLPDSYNNKKPNFKPLLTLKARITSVKQITKGESVSYGRTFTAEDTVKIASVSIGYADGLPRSLSNSGLLVKLGNEYAPAIGRICMDQLVIDVSNIPDVKAGDIAVLIGPDEKISAEAVALKAGTITNELLCRLGSRLKIKS